MAKMPTKSNTVLNRPCYTLAVVDGRDAELTMYGEIVETHPVDWWTGEPVEGQFIVLKEFLDDLETMANCESITIHLNSVGGDAFSAMAIHNRLRELKAEKVCIVDGVAMSGGSMIMCACDKVKVNPSSIVMIHSCWTVVWDRFNSADAQKLADELSVIDNSQAEIYVRKTGKTLDEVRSMMAKDTYMSGREAVEEGFADELLEGEDDPEISVSADHRTLYACGHSMRVAAMGQLPEGIKTVEAAPVGCVDNNTPATMGENEGGTNMPKTLEELRKENPEAAEALLAEAKAVASASAVEAERKRMEDIDAVAALYSDDVVRAAKYGDKACTAQEMCYRAAVESAKQGQKFMSDTKRDYNESGAKDVTPAPSAEEEDKPMTAEQLIAQGKADAERLAKGGK